MNDADKLSKILSTLGNNNKEIDEIDRVLSILSQVALAVLIIFIITSIVFSNKYKNHAEYWKYRSEEFSKTPKGEILVNLQRQQLLLAIERTERYYKETLGHNLFFEDRNGFQDVIIDTIIKNKTVTDRFRNACDFARVELRSQSVFYDKFIENVLDRLQLIDNKKKMNMDIELLDLENREWLQTRSHQITQTIYDDTINVQGCAKEAIAKYYRDHIEEITPLQRLANEMFKEDGKIPTLEQINEFTEEVKIFVKNELVSQNVFFLI